MDRALKERTVGAVVLVVFIVLVVPVFLDGPADDPEIVSEAVTLPGQNGQDRKRQTIVLERDRSEPVPAAATPADRAAPDVPTAKPQPAASEPETADAPGQRSRDATDTRPAASTDAAAAADNVTMPDAQPAETPPQEKPDRSANPGSVTGMWAVQLGSFSNKSNAERLAAELRGNGFAAFLSQVETGGQQLHRVRIGPQKDRASAESTAARLSREGHNGQVVPHP